MRLFDVSIRQNERQGGALSDVSWKFEERKCEKRGERGMKARLRGMDYIPDIRIARDSVDSMRAHRIDIVG